MILVSRAGVRAAAQARFAQCMGRYDAVHACYGGVGEIRRMRAAQIKQHAVKPRHGNRALVRDYRTCGPWGFCCMYHLITLK